MAILKWMKTTKNCEKKKTQTNREIRTEKNHRHVHWTSNYMQIIKSNLKMNSAHVYVIKSSNKMRERKQYQWQSGCHRRYRMNVINSVHFLLLRGFIRLTVEFYEFYYIICHCSKTQIIAMVRWNRCACVCVCMFAMNASQTPTIS